MPTVFETLSDQFYTAFFEPEPDKRRAAIEAWVKAATPVVQSAVENELRSYLEYILEQTWNTEGWQSRAKKFSGTILDGRPQRNIPFTDLYRLVLRLRVERPSVSRGEKLHSVDPVSPEAHAKVLRIAKQILSPIDPLKVTPTPSPLGHQSDTTGGDDDYSGDDGGHSPNDDRSDSMNPNNDSYQASQDNHSNQMNPNNDSYWSSRGR